MDLREFIEANRQHDLCATVDYEGLFRVSVGYLSQRALAEARRKAAVSPNGSRGGAEAAAERFALELAKVVKGWDGLSVGVLSGLTNVAVPEGTAPETAIDCTPANVVALFEEVPGFFDLVMRLATDLEAQRRQGLEDERKN